MSVFREKHRLNQIIRRANVSLNEYQRSRQHARWILHWNHSKIDLRRPQPEHFRRLWVQKSVTWITYFHPPHVVNNLYFSVKPLRQRLLLSMTNNTLYFCRGLFRRSTLRASRSSCRRSWRANSPKSSVNTSSCRLATRDPNPVPHPLTNPESLVSVERKSSP